MVKQKAWFLKRNFISPAVKMKGQKHKNLTFGGKMPTIPERKSKKTAVFLKKDPFFLYVFILKLSKVEH